jgi:hypothetical protein
MTNAQIFRVGSVKQNHRQGNQNVTSQSLWNSCASTPAGNDTICLRYQVFMRFFSIPIEDSVYIWYFSCNWLRLYIDRRPLFIYKIIKLFGFSHVFISMQPSQINYKGTKHKKSWAPLRRDETIKMPGSLLQVNTRLSVQNDGLFRRKCNFKLHDKILRLERFLVVSYECFKAFLQKFQKRGRIWNRITSLYTF